MLLILLVCSTDYFHLFICFILDSQERELRAPLRARCSWECTHLVFTRGDESPTEVPAVAEREVPASQSVSQSVSQPVS